MAAEIDAEFTIAPALPLFTQCASTARLTLNTLVRQIAIMRSHSSSLMSAMPVGPAL